MSQNPSKVSKGTSKNSSASSWSLLGYLGIGAFFGIVLLKSEAVSWFRIQEMFRFQGFYMYGLLMTGVLTSALVLAVFKKLGMRSLTGEKVSVGDKPWQPGQRHRYWLGGIVFGLGWGLAGTCPGPMYALLGYGVGAAAVALLSALVGVRVYALLAKRLPH